MGTRATYEFRDEYRGTQTFYIHWDGYPEGAAMYFRQMFEFNQWGASLAAKFFRGNPTAEFTQDKDAHGDTDYHYVLEDYRKIQAFKILRNYETGDCAYNTVFRGDLYEFIEKYGDEPFEPLPSMEVA